VEPYIISAHNAIVRDRKQMFDHFNTAFLNGQPVVVVLGNEVEVANENKINRLVFTKETVDSLEVSESGILVTKGMAAEFISMSQVFSLSTSIDEGND